MPRPSSEDESLQRLAVDGRVAFGAFALSAALASLSGIGSPNVPSPGSDSLMGGAGSDNLGSGLGMTPEEAADMAALLQKKKQRGNPFDNIDWGFAEAPRISGGGGDARSTGNMLLEALNAPTAADMLLKKRLQGIR